MVEMMCSTSATAAVSGPAVHSASVRPRARPPRALASDAALQPYDQSVRGGQEPLPRAGRFAGLDISVEDVRVPAKYQAPTASTACSDSSPTALDETPVKRVGAITPPTRSTSCSSAGSSPRLPMAEVPYAPYAPFALPCLLPSPSSCRAIAQGY